MTGRRDRTWAMTKKKGGKVGYELMEEPFTYQCTNITEPGTLRSPGMKDEFHQGTIGLEYHLRHH